MEGAKKSTRQVLKPLNTTQKRCPNCGQETVYEDFEMEQLGDTEGKYTARCTRCGWEGFEWYALEYITTTNK